MGRISPDYIVQDGVIPRTALPEVLKAVHDGETIYVVEGEKDAESWRQRGYVATCGAMGAGKWEPEYTETLTAAGMPTPPRSTPT